MASEEFLEDNLEDILQKARSGKGLSVRQVAAATEIPEQTLRGFETARLAPSHRQIHRLADCLDLNPDKLWQISEGHWVPRIPADRLEEWVIPVQGRIGDYPVNGYILYDRETRTAACIDTAYAPDQMLARLADRQLRLRYILLTHCHQDHMGGVERLQKETGADIMLHALELPLFQSQSPLDPGGRVDEQTQLSLGTIQIAALCTPGHTPGGITYTASVSSHTAPQFCFVGDALFAGSTGRSLSPQGYQELRTSLQEKVLSLPPETIILPGHGPVTTVGEENRCNPFF